ncbi:MAG TPA: phosphatidate cytidylyltransferase [Chitinophagaceae bacterium]|nr:phosphatidate cytidylyltransferase [Chitinophagaceae bacterium]
MAFNWPIFRKRAMTAIVFVAVMLAGLFWNHWSFFILFTIIHFGCWWEYLQLTEKIQNSRIHLYSKIGFMLMGYGIMLWFCGDRYQINNYGLKENISLPLSLAGFLLLLIGIFQKQAVQLKSFGMAALGLIYISLCWGLMMHLYQHEFDIRFPDRVVAPAAGFFPMLVIFSIWINDTMAYIVGSLIGKTPLTPISPKKTWEGTIGGIMLCIVAMSFLFPLLYFEEFNLSVSVMILPVATIIAISGTFGDLLESKLKRMAGVKDSGRLLPGHGGFLDRFDSLLLATPFVWLYVNLFLG